MSRRKNPEKPSDTAISRPPVRVPRRRRRKAARPQQFSSGGKPSPQDGGESGYAGRNTDPVPVKMGRAPRAAEPPLPNPNVFSYTFTIWKST